MLGIDFGIWTGVQGEPIGEGSSSIPLTALYDDDGTTALMDDDGTTFLTD